jgi:trk system potassium uptake protein TrkA
LIGTADNFEKCRKLFHTEPPRRTRVFIMGGTALGVWLSRALNSRRFALRLVEEDRARCDELSRKLEWVTILHGDPASSNIFEEEHVEQADAFVALTNDDENNILNAARAKSMGVTEAIAVLQRPTYLHLIKHVGIDRAFSPRVTAVNEIQKLLDDSPVRTLASLADGIADVYEIDVPEGAVDVLNKPLEEIVFPEHSMVAGIQRGEDVKVPGAKDTIAAGDRVIMIGPAGMTKKLRKLFDAK